MLLSSRPSWSWHSALHGAQTLSLHTVFYVEVPMKQKVGKPVFIYCLIYTKCVLCAWDGKKKCYFPMTLIVLIAIVIFKIIYNKREKVNSRNGVMKQNNSSLPCSEYCKYCSFPTVLRDSSVRYWKTNDGRNCILLLHRWHEFPISL